MLVLLGQFVAAQRAEIERRLTSPVELVVMPEGAAPSALAEALGQARIVASMAWSATLPPAPRLALLQLCATGIDRVEPAALPPGVTVCNVFGHEDAIGEYVVLGMLASAHRLIEQDRDFRAGSWDASGYMAGTPHGEIMGATVGLLGWGRIGRAAAHRLRGFGTRTIVVNRSPVRDEDADETFGLDALDAVLPRLDYLVVACAATPETIGLIDRRRLSLMKPGAVVINVARAPIVDEAALFDALRRRHLGGAVLDAWYRYPAARGESVAPSAFPFRDLPNVIMTPHSSGWTTGAIDRRWTAVAANIDRFLQGRPLANIVFRS